jgi:hypothetical protein
MNDIKTLLLFFLPLLLSSGGLHAGEGFAYVGVSQVVVGTGDGKIMIKLGVDERNRVIYAVAHSKGALVDQRPSPDNADEITIFIEHGELKINGPSRSLPFVVYQNGDIRRHKLKGISKEEFLKVINSVEKIEEIEKLIADG